ARHGNGADEAGARLVPRATHFNGQGLPQIALEIGLANVTNPEPCRRGPLSLPALGGAGAALHVDRQVRVGVPPVDLGQRAVQRDAIVEVEERRHVVMRKSLDPEEYDHERKRSQNPESHRNLHSKATDTLLMGQTRWPGPPSRPGTTASMK